MPLPFAPKPDESKVYQSLKSVLLDEVTPTQLDHLRSEVFAQGTDGTEDEFRRLVLLGAAALASSSSGPIPGTGITYYKQQTSTGSRGTLFNPDEGCWQVGPVSFQLSNNTGSVAVQAWIEADDDTSTNRRVLWADASTSSTSYATLHENLAPVYIDANTTVKVEFTGTADAVNFYMYAIRVR